MKSLSLKQLAHHAISDLVYLIQCGDTTAWQRAYKIERRWHIQGACLFLVTAAEKRHADYLKAQSKRHDYLFPDRLTYLHR